MYKPRNVPIQDWVLVYCSQYDKPQRVPFEYAMLSDGSRMIGPIATCENGNGSAECARCLNVVRKQLSAIPDDQELPTSMCLADEG